VPCLVPTRRLAERNRRSTRRWPKTASRAPKRTRPTRTRGSWEAASPPTRPVAMASRMKPTESFRVPAARAIWPKSRRTSPSSLTILARTGKLEAPMAMAMNRAKATCPPAGPRRDPGTSSPTTNPAAKGSSRLAADTAAAGRPSWRRRSRSVSKPTVSRSRARLIVVTESRRADWTGCPEGRNQSKPAGHSAPKTLGPRSTPAASSPITRGCRSRSASAPSSLAVRRRTASWTQKIDCSRALRGSSRTGSRAVNSGGSAM